MSFQQQATVPVSYSVPKTMFDAIEKRAKTMNIRAAEYIRRLSEAGWLARVKNERGEEPEDAALDRQVKQVFLLADCEADYIAEALQLPIERVNRILEAWRSPAWRDSSGHVAQRLTGGPTATQNDETAGETAAAGVALSALAAPSIPPPLLLRRPFPRRSAVIPSRRSAGCGWTGRRQRRSPPRSARATARCRNGSTPIGTCVRSAAAKRQVSDGAS